MKKTKKQANLDPINQQVKKPRKSPLKKKKEKNILYKLILNGLGG